MTVVTVNSTQTLMRAVATAADGDVIKLAAGTYSNVNLQGLNFTKGLTITSADPNRQAVLTDLMISGSKGLKVQGLDLVNKSNVDLAFKVQGSSNIVLDNLDVSGSGNTTAAMNARLMMIRSSSNITVTNSEFFNGWHGISMLNNNGVRIEDNYFHDLRTDGVRGGGNSNLTIRANVFTNFHPAPLDHPDAIQLWTVNTSQSVTNIVIDENVVTRGTGTQIQGIFLRDITGNTPFTNVTVTNNLIEGARGNGIALNGVKNGTVTNNIVQGFPDHKSGMQMSNSTGMNVSNNLSSLFFGAMKTLPGTSGNKTIAYATDSGLAMAASWLKMHTGFVTAWKLSDPSVLTSVLHMGTSGGGSAPIPGPTLTTQTTQIAALSVAAADTTASDTAAADDDDSTGNPGVADPTFLARIKTAIEDANAALAAAATPADDTDGAGTSDDTDGGDSAPITAVTDDDASEVDDTPDDTVLAAPTADDDDADGSVTVFEGGAGHTLSATPGADQFHFAVATGQAGSGGDIITGFESGVDKIVLKDAQAEGGNEAGQSFTFIDQSTFTGHAGEVRYFDADAGVTVQTDIDGDGFADLEFSLRDIHSLSVRDFIL
ncbi:MAG: right-handed parallel beta-helix repeat-containing protein [Sphingobium sp.]|nr:right-handed parallel beta-helix repeat-containing protein [Sphingobium sp.]MBP6112061.1 right-handed parallel beta-helix repeat-containing protein [Sphingobium sp.]MBP8671677.1 right-handed parallel beta-helix repeat-containing protein [Sphingobium sp.]MBP9158583.1 right-handed parallel beta-helix repeat-containing protein [Sphingobium sp.]MCC6482773.1 right-handed parallel beta-helix repeat-containing protein [Sphingomonadaceae bacterium]